jgi:steroid 5-alpha reductase family enzyme
MATSYVGVLRDTLLPNLIFHTSLALPAYVYARSTDTVDTKDYLWASGQLSNALYTAIGSRLILGVPLSIALATITRPGWLVLSGVALWASRLTYRVISRSVRRGKDDERYDYVKEEKGGWSKAIWSLFLPEAIVQSLVSLPFTAPFRTTYPVLACPSEWKATVEALAIGLFGVGFALEVLADWQLEKFKQSGETGINREGVWSIVRHPK